MTVILLLIFLGSLAGIVFLLSRKIPLLLELPSVKDEGVRALVVSKTKSLVKSRKLQAVTPEKILSKALSKTRVVAMKTEARTGEWLSKLRQQSRERKGEFRESYWEQFRKKGKKKK